MGFKYCDACKYSSLRKDPHGDMRCLSSVEVDRGLYDVDGDETCTGFTENDPPIKITCCYLCYVKSDGRSFFGGGKDVFGCFWWREIPKYLYDALIRFEEEGK